MKRKVIFLLILSTVFFIPSIKAYRNDTIQVTDITEDGHVEFTDPGYSKTNNSSPLKASNVGDKRAYIEFDLTSLISELPSGAIIDRVDLRFRTETNGGEPDIYDMNTQPSISSDETIYADAANGTCYYEFPDTDPSTWYTQDLGSDAVDDLQATIDGVETWFAIGISIAGGGGLTWIYSEESTDDPLLIVYYHDSTDYRYVFNGHYYENGTNAGTINITAYFPTNDTQTIVVDGTTTRHFQEHPILFTFPVDSDTRRLYGTGSAENFTVFSPEDEHVNYEFSVIDYTGKLSDGAYLEAYRTVNGTEELIERMIIYDQINTVPMALVVGATYHMKVLWADGTSYDWGYWPAGSDPTPSIVLYRLNFSQKAQLTYKYINIEATRPNATHIRLNYEDSTPTGYETTWCNITLTYRNETTVTTYNSSSESFSWNWYSADNETDYWVLVEIVHTFFNNREYAKLLDAPDESYSTFLNLDVLGTLGGLNTANTFSAIIVLCVFGVGSRKNVDVALISGFSIAGILRFIGANTWSYNLLAFGFALSVAFAIYRGRVKS